MPRPGDQGTVSLGEYGEHLKNGNGDITRGMIVSGGPATVPESPNR